MARWLLIDKSPDGVRHQWYGSDDAAQAMLRDPLDEASVTTFRSLTGTAADDPDYWPEGAGLLLKVEPVMPEPVTTAYMLPR